MVTRFRIDHGEHDIEVCVTVGYPDRYDPQQIELPEITAIYIDEREVEDLKILGITDAVIYKLFNQFIEDHKSSRNYKSI